MAPTRNVRPASVTIERGSLGIYTEYIDRKLEYRALVAERRAQLGRISTIRDRDVLVFAANIARPNPQMQIGYGDLLPIRDQLSNLKGGRGLDLILETPGGSAESAEQIVRIIRNRYDHVAVIVPGMAMSAGTIMALAADDILMDEASALGPIDAQLIQQGKVFSAEALLKGFDRIKDEVASTGVLNKAYIPMLQAVSPGELEAASNALALGRQLVRDYLVRHKFKDWTVHSSNGAPVTDDEKSARAEEIASQLASHGRWRSHGRPIMLQDLEAMRVKITNFSTNPELADAIRRYFVLLHMTFDGTPIFKIFETPTSQIHRALTPTTPQQLVATPEPNALGGGRRTGVPGVGDLTVNCSCGHDTKLQVNLGQPAPLRAGRKPYPVGDDLFRCPSCGTTHNLREAREQLEKQTGQKVV